MPFTKVKSLSYGSVDRALAADLGIVALFFFDEASGTMRDVLSNTSVAIGSQTITVGTDERGTVLKFDGGLASCQRLPFTLPLPSTALSSGNLQGNINGFTVMGRFKPTVAPAGNPGQFFGLCASSGSQASIGIGCDTSVNVGFTWLSGAGAGTVSTSSGSVGTWYTVYASAVSTTTWQAWVNGKPNTPATAVNGGAGLLDEIVFGAQDRSAGFLRQAKGNLEWAAIMYSTPMTDDLAFRLYADDFPYNLLRPRRNRVFFKSSAVGGSTTISLLGSTWSATPSSVKKNYQFHLPSGTHQWTANNISIGSSSIVNLVGSTWQWAANTIKKNFQFKLSGATHQWSVNTIVPQTAISLASSTWQWTTNAILKTVNFKPILDTALWRWTAKAFVAFAIPYHFIRSLTKPIYRSLVRKITKNST